MTVQEEVGKCIKLLRKRMGISQEALALKANIDRRYMSDIENGKRNISVDILDRLAKFFGIPLSELLDISESAGRRSVSVDGIKEWLRDNDYNDTVLLESPDYVSAIVGITDDGRLVYLYSKMVDFLIDEDGMTEDEAIEFIDYNTVRALPYMGQKAPVIMYDLNL